MRIEQQTTSLELSKKLKELDVKGESLFVWQQTTEGRWYVNDSKLFDWGSECYPAFTVAELGEILPEKLNKEPLPHLLTIMRFGQWEVSYRRNPADFIAFESDKTLANTLAKMLIYLLEKKLL
jgi:hypothetical protein